MSWLKENSFLAGLAATTIIAGAALVFLMMQSMTQYRETREAYTQAVRKLHALQNRSPFPNAENFEKSRALEEQFKAELDSLRARLAKMQEPASLDVQPQKFQDDLRTAVNRIAEKAGAAGVELPKGFYLGFSQYANSLPNEHAAPALARQLAIIERIVADLIGFKVQSIDGLNRPPLPEESASVIQKTEDAQQRGRQSEAKPSGLRRQPFDLAFTAEHGKLRVAFNSLLDSDQFLIVRNLTFQFPADGVGPLLDGEVAIEGRIMPASNATFFGSVRGAGVVACVYKPVAGERPLWDFPDGTLARREVAAYAVSEALGWDVVPPTVLRDGPAGLGMVQAWREPDPEQAAVDLVPVRRLPEGFLHVLDAYDGEDRPISLVHEDSAPLRRMAVFDVLVNNADRKGGHVLAMPDGHRHGVDHGLSFHVDDKLRTVLWGWAEDPLDADDAAAVRGLLERVCVAADPLRAELDELLAGHEVDAFVGRCERLLARRRMPAPSGEWRAIPWPAF